MDRLYRAISDDHDLRVIAATTTELVREACRRHEIGGAEAIALGRALTAGCLLSTLSKSPNERVRLELRGGGPLGKIHVDSRSDGRVRGFLSRPEEAASEPLPERGDGRRRIGALVGDGVLVVTRDLDLEAPYQGVVALTTGEIDEDLQDYLDRSEQMPSALGCEVLLDAQGGVLRAAGVLVQTFPGGDAAALADLRVALADGALADLLRQPRGGDALIGFALGGGAFAHTGEPTALAFTCACDLARARAVLALLGAEDLDALADEQGPTEVRCSFCGARYGFSEAQLRELAAELRRERS